MGRRRLRRIKKPCRCPDKAKELSAVAQYRRQEKLHNEQLMNMIKKEQKREKARRKTLLQIHPSEEKEKLQAL